MTTSAVAGKGRRVLRSARLPKQDSAMTDTTLRYIETLRAIPRYPAKTTAGEVHQKLAGAGYAIDRRSVERDLRRLSGIFPISCDEGARPVGWFWPTNAPDLIAPGMTGGEALELELMARYLKPLLPKSSWATLNPRVETAKATLRTLGSAALKRWRTRVAVLDDGQPLLAPQVPADVVSVVHESLLHGRRFSVNYRSLETDEPRRYELNPIALVHVGQVGYLVATLWDYEDLRHLALHRMSKPEVLQTAARQPQDFDLQVYLREKMAFDIPGERDIALTLRVSDWLARHLEERRLSEGQTIEAQGEDAHLVRATVRESERLVWWLRSHGEAVEVIEPPELRARLAEEFAALVGRYSHPGA